MKRTWVSIAILLLCGAALFAAGGKEAAAPEPEIVTTISAPVTIEFWHGMSSKLGETLVKLCDQFNATVGKEKGITVVPVFQGSYNDLKQKTTAAIKAGTAPAVAQGYCDYVAEFMQADVVVPLNPYINHPTVGIKDLSDIFPGYLEENSSYDTEGTFYSLPFNKSTEVLFYNRTFFEKYGLTVPTTWDELTEVSRKATAILGKPAFGYDSLANYMITMIRQFGGRYTDGQGNLYFNQGDAAVKAIQLYQKNMAEGIWRIAGEDRYMSGPFVNGDVVMFIGSTAGASYIKTDQFIWDSAPIPVVKGGKKAVIQQGTNVFIMNQGKTPEEVYASFEFVKFLISKEANFIWATSTGYLPIRKSVVDSPEYQAWLKTTTDTTKKTGPAQGGYYFYDPGFYTPNYASNDVRLAMQKAIEDALLNGTDARAAIDAAYAKLVR